MLGFFSVVRLVGRARYVGFLLGSLVILIAATVLSAQFSGRQAATVGLDVGLSVIRILLPLVMVLMAQELISREFERRYFLSSMSYPVSRARFFLTRFFVLVLSGQMFLCVLAVALALIVGVLETYWPQSTPVDLRFGYVWVVFFISVDFWVLASVAGFLAVVASTSSFVLVGVFGFMLVARSYASVSELLANNSFLVADAESYRAGIGVLGYFLPNLGGLDIRGMSLYSQEAFLPGDWFWMLVSAVSYSLGFVLLAVWFIKLKRFA